MQTKSKQQQFQAPMFNNKNCQAEKSVIMWPVKPQMDMQLKKHAQKLIGLAKGKNSKVQ